MSSPSPVEKRGRAVGRYVLFDQIASGGMATVHFARLSGSVGFTRTVAVKRLHPHLAQEAEFVAMFLDEARVASRIRHPNVVPTLDVVALGDEVFIVMEYVQGEALSRLFRAQRNRGSPMPVAFATAIIAAALHGLHAAHEAKGEEGEDLNIVHRDVSPQNLLVGTDGVPRVLDFGIAKAVGRIQNTQEGSLKGKVPYMSPEQLTGAEVTRRSDIYSASVVLWELLAGQRLHEEVDGDAAIVAKVLGLMVDGRIDPPSRHNPDVPHAINEIVLRGLSPLPENRFETARDMAIALEKSGGVVAASELGAWVDALASEVLTKRAKRLARIESKAETDALHQASSSERPRELRKEEDTETVVGPDAAQNTPVMSTATGVALGLTPSPKKRRRVIALTALIVAASAGGASLWLTRTTPRVERAAPGVLGSLSAASSSSSVPAESSLISSSSSSSSPATDTATTATASDPVKKPAPTHPSASVVTAKKIDPRTMPSSTRLKTCDPPYTFDDEGHKVYKRECLH